MERTRRGGLYKKVIENQGNELDKKRKRRTKGKRKKNRKEKEEKQ